MIGKFRRNGSAHVAEEPLGPKPSHEQLKANLYADTPGAWNIILGDAYAERDRAVTALKWQRIVDSLIVVGLICVLVVLIRTGGNHVVAVPIQKDGIPAGAAREVAFAATPTDAAIQSRISDCVIAMYSASPDNVVNRLNLTKAYSCLSGAARGYFDTYNAGITVNGVTTPPMSAFVRGHKGTVEVTLEKIETLSNQSYHVSYVETERNMSGALVTREQKSATFQVGIVSGQRPINDVIANPFGILITTITPDTNLTQGAHS